jgi:hypothetical protein
MKAQLESLVAISALLVATIAAAASAYQTYVINEQFSAAVWPYLSFDTSNDTSSGDFALGVRNVGLGPAIIRDTSVTLDGKLMGRGITGNPVYTAIEDAIRQSKDEEAKRHEHGQVKVTASSLDRGDVLPAGSSLTLLHVKGADLFARVEALQPHFDLSLCYCSILGRCWTRRLKDPIPEPHGVRSCPVHA